MARSAMKAMTLSAFILLLLSSVSFSDGVSAPPEIRFLEAPEIPLPGLPGARGETLNLFAAEGPGSHGSPGTDEKGFTFDGPNLEAEPAGWFGVDRNAQEGIWWHLDSTEICAGHGTDFSEALPFDYPIDPTNDYALWCGRENVSCWLNPTGYGNYWDQWVEVDLDHLDIQEDLTISFDYITDYEAGGFEDFTVDIEIGNENNWQTLFADSGNNNQQLQHVDLVVEGGTFGQAALALRFQFESDFRTSDEDGLFLSDVGAVWLDNIVLSYDGQDFFASDFEDEQVPSGLSFEVPESCGDNAALRRRGHQSDPCIYNVTHYWAFYSQESAQSGYPFIPYWCDVNNAIESPLLEQDQLGQPLQIDIDDRVLLEFDVYRELDYFDMVFYFWEVAVQMEGENCPRSFQNNYALYYGNQKWHHSVHDITETVTAAADGNLEDIVGLVVRVGVIDACAFWECHGYEEHNSTPYFDNISLSVTLRPDVVWEYDERCRLQDSFAGDGGTVRLDPADNIAPTGMSMFIPGDSTVIEVNMDPLGGVGMALNPTSGMELPAVYLWWKVSAGPNQGFIDAAMADPDGSDGLWSPWVGTVEFDGEIWGVMQADSSLFKYEGYEGHFLPDHFAFDFNDAYFEPGDQLSYFFRAEAVGGEARCYPEWAMISDPAIRDHLSFRCLPTSGVGLLLVTTGELPALSWFEAFRYNGYLNYDFYMAQHVAWQYSGSKPYPTPAHSADLDDLSCYDAIVWDCGHSLNSLPGDGYSGAPVDDTGLLNAWLAEVDHPVGLWLLSNHFADILNPGNPFLTETLGINSLGGGYWGNQYVPVFANVIATHPYLQYLGDSPNFDLTGCPIGTVVSEIEIVGPLAEVTHEWREGPAGTVAGVLNRDPDGDGTYFNAQGYLNPTLFNPFSYFLAVDTGYGLAAGVDYVRYMVGQVLTHFFSHGPGGPGNAVDTQPMRTQLAGAYPNPFNPSTTIRYSLASAEQVTVSVYDVAGRRIRALWEGRQEAGEQELIWDGRGDAGERMASGVYFLQFKAGRVEENRKLVLLK